MRLPDAVFATLVAERNRYGAVPTARQLGVILNNTAYTHRGEGFGLSRKDSGSNAPFPGGNPPFIAHDILMLSDGTAWDCLIAAGAESLPYQGESFLITDPNRAWVRPVPPDAQPEPPPPPSNLEARVLELEAQVAELQAKTLKTNDTVALASYWGTFVCADADELLRANRSAVGAWECFRIFRP